VWLKLDNRVAVSIPGGYLIISTLSPVGLAKWESYLILVPNITAQSSLTMAHFSAGFLSVWH
jgi:hypothetical protein